MNQPTSQDSDFKMNGQRYKENSEAYIKLKKKLVRLFGSQELIDELKRRKIVHINWDSMKYDFGGM